MPCILCGRRKTAVLGVFIAKHQAALGAPAGKVRTCVFTLCRRCQRQRGVLKRVEAQIERDLADVAGRN